MHRLVMWGFTLALIPLSLAVVWDGVTAFRAYFAPGPAKDQLAGAQPFGNDRPHRGT